MKIVKINKTYRSGNIEHFLVLLEEPYSNDDIDYLVEEWCDEDLSGSNYGYSYEWTFVEDNDLRKLFSMSKVYVNPSIIEGFGLPIIEALKCGANVICSNIKIFNEVGENYVQYFDPYSVKDLIIKLNNTLALDDTNSSPDQNYFQKFSWQQSAKNTFKYYKTII
jgi:glycosyltransferase involved in cell wall biosynthesis